MERADIPAYQRKENSHFTLNPSLSVSLVSLKKMWFLYVFAFFLSRACFLDSMFPFGIAYFAALLINCPSIALGAGVCIFLGLLTVMSVWLALGYLACMISLFFIITFLYAKDQVIERAYSILLPVLAAIFLTKNIFMLLCRQWNTYEMTVGFFESLLIAILAVIFFYGIRVLVGRYCLKMLGVEEMVSLIILIAVLITGVPQVKIGMLSFGGILGKALVMIFAYIGGAGIGASLGVTVGVVSSLSAIISPMTIGLYAFSGLLAGIFKEFGKFGVGIGFILGNVILSLYLGNASNIIHSLLESLLALGLLFFVPKKQMERAAEIVPGTPENIHKQLIYHQRLQGVIGERVRDFSKVFLQLSATFEKVMQKTKTTGQTEMTEAFQLLCRKNCQDCQGYQECWEKNFYQTYQSILDMLTLTEIKGEITYLDLPKEFRYKCIRTSKMLQAINYLSDIYRVNYYWQKKLQESRALAVNQLKGVSQVMDTLASQVKVDLDYKEETEKMLLEELHHKSILVEDLAVLNLGNDNLEIQIKKIVCEGQGQCTAQIVPLISRTLGKEMILQNNKCAYKMGKGICDLKLCTYLTYEIVTAVASSASEEISGDSFSEKRVNNGKAVVMLSDGMGTGSGAALESGATTALLGQLLEAGVERDIAIQTVNAALILRSKEEKFSTIDLVLFDLYTGEIDFVKLGSSPSFIKRGREVLTIRANSLPLGILNSIDIEKSQWILRNDDLIVMATDGVMDAFPDDEEQESWIIQFLENVALESSPQKIADQILREAMSRFSYRKRDDMTVAVVKLQKRGVQDRVLWV